MRAPLLLALVSGLLAFSSAGCAAGSGGANDSGRGGGVDGGAGSDGSASPDASLGDAELPLPDAQPEIDARVSCVAGSCDDGDPCTTDTCGPDGVCVFEPLACDDGNACTVDTCSGGSCTSAPMSCDDGDACTTDACSAGACGHTRPMVSGDTCALPIEIAASGTFMGNSSCALSDVSGVGCGSGDAPDVFFRLTLTAASDVTLDATGTSYDSVLALGASCGMGELGCDDDGAGSGAARLVRTSLAAGTYYVVLDGKAGAAGGAWRVTSTITPVAMPETVVFPRATDSFSPTHGYLWELGSYVQGSRTTRVASITSLDYAISPVANVLSCDNQDMRLLVNGTEVGRLTFTPSTTTLSGTFSFARITGPTYTLRLENVRAVSGGCGSAQFGDSSPASTITLRP